MFYYLDGTVAEILPYLAVIDCGGVGYACKTTNTTLAQLKKGQRGKLYTYLDVGENAFGPGGRLALLRGGLRCGRPGGAADGADYRPLHRLRRGAPHRRGALLRLPGPDGRRHPLLFAAVCHHPLHL